MGTGGAGVGGMGWAAKVCLGLQEHVSWREQGSGREKWGGEARGRSWGGQEEQRQWESRELRIGKAKKKGGEELGPKHDVLWCLVSAYRGKCTEWMPPWLTYCYFHKKYNFSFASHWRLSHKSNINRGLFFNSLSRSKIIFLWSHNSIFVVVYLRAMEVYQDSWLFHLTLQNAFSYQR